MIIKPANRTLSVKEYYFSIKNKEIAKLNGKPLDYKMKVGEKIQVK